MFDLPIPTFLLAIGVPILSIVLSLIYAIFFHDDEKWLTVEDIIEMLRG